MAIGLAAFMGFFAAMAVVNLINAFVVRSAASAVYALLVLVVAAIEAYSIPHGKYGGALLHAALLSCYFCTLVVFAFTLLRTTRYDRGLAYTVLGVLGVNVVLVFVEDLSFAWRTSHFYVLDQIALDALIAALAVVGIRAIAHEGRIAGIYLAALVGPAIGLILNDLSTNSVIAHSPAFIFSWDFGVVWEASFFAYAVALRNRGVQNERDRFARLAYVDGLTGVPNRRTFDETLDRMWNVARRARVPLSVAMIDIDHFKRLNDTRGHQVGDECLRRIAALGSSALRRAGDCFARYGGEEFAAILLNADLGAAVTLAETIRRTVERDGGITVSIGVATGVPAAGERPQSLVALADEALYRAKHDGRNLVRAAEPARASI